MDPEEAARRGDGIDMATLELNTSERAAFRILRRPDVVELLQAQRLGEALEEGAAKALSGASALGFLRVKGEALGNFFQAGRALQHIWLEATKRQWAVHPMASLLYLRKLVDLPQVSVFTKVQRAQLCQLSDTVEDIFTVNREW